MSAARRAGLGARRVRRPGHSTLIVLSFALAGLLMQSPEHQHAAHAQAGEASTYEVRPGDSLWLIGERFGCTAEAIQQANGVAGETIQPGQMLTIPACEGERSRAAIYTVQPGDILGAIAERHGCTVAAVRSENDLSSADMIRAGQELRIPVCEQRGAAGSEDGSTYTVQPGDILGTIAERHGCTVSELMTANGLSNDLILAGATLTIPDCIGPVFRGGQRRPRTVDRDTLPRLMQERGFSPPRRFKALVLEITFDARRQRVVAERAFDYAGTADDETGWNPASAIKLYPAIAAVQFARALGFSPDAEVTFHSNGSDRGTQLEELVVDALGPSDNIAYNRLVQLVGFDRLNADFLQPSNGFESSGIRRAYAQSRWSELGEEASFRNSPAITLREGRRSRRLDAREGNADTECRSSACTTLMDLAECMRRLMLQEQLEPEETYQLQRSDLLMIRRALRAERRRGEEVVDELSRSFDGEGVRLYHKAGFSQDWYSDNVYIFDPRFADQAWIVTLAGYPGRDSLSDAARIIGEILASGELRRTR